MLENTIDVSPGTLLTIASWTTAAGLLVAGWTTGADVLLGLALLASVVGATLLVLRDNAKTRRVVRACVLEREQRDFWETLS